MGIEIWIADALDDKALFAYQEGTASLWIAKSKKAAARKCSCLLDELASCHASMVLLAERANERHAPIMCFAERMHAQIRACASRALCRANARADKGIRIACAWQTMPD